MEKLIGKEKYFVYKGTWENNYEWRIRKIKITGLKIDKDGKRFAEFSFHCCGYEYPVEYLKNTLLEAKKLAIEEILEEKEKQLKTIKNWKEFDCIK